MKNLSSTLLSLCVLAFFSFPVSDTRGETFSPDSGIKLQKGADYQIVKEYKYSDFKIIQLNLARLSHFSYMLFSKGSCMLIDPGRRRGNLPANSPKGEGRNKSCLPDPRSC